MRPSFNHHHSPFASRIAASHRGAVPDHRVKFRRRRCNCARSTARSSQVALLILLGIHCSTRWMLIQLSLISSAAYATLQGHACSVHLQTGRSNAIRQEPRCSILHRCPSIRSRDASNASSSSAQCVTWHKLVVVSVLAAHSSTAALGGSA